MKKKIFLFSMILAISMSIPLTAHAEQNFQISEKPIFQQDENGNLLYLHEEQPVVGKFSIMPDYLIGDVNLDGEINAFDAALILCATADAGSNGGTTQEILFEMFPEYNTSEQVLLYADINNDTMIDAIDATEILVYEAIFGAGAGMHPLGYASYYADENGILQTGWIQDTETGDMYYAKEDCKLVMGWLYLEGNNYYFDSDGKMLTGLQEILGKKYYFDENGVMLTGWQLLDNINYYFNANGTMHTGWLTDGENTYYFDKNGNFVTGWQEIHHRNYYFDENGIMLTGWQILDGLNYYFNANGSMLTGWLVEGENSYYFAEDGILTKGWLVLDDKNYYFDENGILHSGWLILNDSQYYFDENGIMQTGWIQDNGLYYYLDEDGILLKRQWLFLEDKTYYLGIKGDALTGWQDLSGYIYYFQEDGLMSTGWQTINNKEYYFYPENGTMAKNTTIDDKKIGADGVVTVATVPSSTLVINQERAKNAFAQYGSSVNEIYNYMRSTNRYKYIESTRTLEQIEANGWLYYVDYAFTHYYGVCYYMTAKMDFLLQQAGYECRIIHATHGSGDHYWNQVYINGDWVNYDCTNGYNAYSWDSMIHAGNYIFLGYVYPVYE
ncbi:MAG: hypothetical protein HDT22_04550 [Ruminococcus sp.]|nr:hypothetical protein [Ruminococcus sp.]